MSDFNCIDNPAFPGEYCQIIQKLPAMVVVADPDGQIIIANNRYAAFTGHPAEELIGRNLWEVQFPALAPQERNVLREQVVARDEWRDEVICSKKDGTQYWATVTVSTIRDDSGVAARLLMVNEDITERKRAEDSLVAAELTSRREVAQLKAILDQMTEGLAIFDPQGNLLEMNHAALTIHGFREGESPRAQFGELRGTYELFDLDGEPLPVDQWPIGRVLRGETIHGFEARVKRKDIEKVWVGSYGGAPVRDPDGNVVSCIVTMRDITAQKQAEEALRESEERYRMLFANMTEGFAIGEAIGTTGGGECDFTFVDINPSFERQTGLSREIIGKPVKTALPNLETQWVENYCRVAATGEAIRFETFNAASGRIYDVYSYSPSKGRFAAIITDISEKRRSEDVIRRREAELREAQRIANVGSWWWRPDSGTIYWSEETYRIFGIDPSMPAPRSLDDNRNFFSHESYSRLIHAVEEAMTRGTPYELELTTPGNTRYLTARGEVERDESGRAIGLRGTLQDVTPRKRIEEELKAQRQLLESVVHNMPAGVLLAGSEDLRIVFVNPQYQSFAPEKEMVGKTIEEVWPEIQPGFGNILREVAGTGKPHRAVDERFLLTRAHKAPREERHFTWSAVRVIAAGGGWAILITAWETTDRKRVETQLRHSRDLLNAVLEGTASHVVAIDKGYRLVTFNTPFREAIRHLYGREVKEGESLEELLHDYPDDYSAAKHIWARALSGEQFILEQEFGDLRRNRRYFELRFHPMRDAEGRVIGATQLSVDISERKAHEQALRESEERFRGIFENAAVGISLIDRETRIVRMNAKLRDILGYEEEDLKGVPFDKITYPADTVPDLSRYRLLMNGDVDSYSLEKRYIRKDDRYVWVRVTRAAQPGKRGLPDYSINIVEDISSRKEAEEQLHRTATLLRAVTENTPDFIYVKDREGRMLMANPATLRDLGKSPAEVYGRTDAEFLGGEGAERIMEHDRQVMERRETLVVEEIPRPAGNRRVYLSSKSPYFDEKGAVIGMIGISRDITDLKRAAEEREQLLSEVQRSNDDLQRFAYVASHDLQEPLRMVSSYMQLLERRYGDTLDEKGHTYIHHAVNGTKRMQSLIEGLLKYSRISRDKELVPVDTRMICTTAIANLQAALKESGGEVTTGELPVVPGDETQLSQLFQNLIGNALKYRKPDVPPKVRVLASHEDGHWLFSIADNGIGIEPLHFDRIFQIFQRLHTQEEYPGTGIGLASCKKIVERHGGRIWLESAPGQGSTFYFTLPAEQ